MTEEKQKELNEKLLDTLSDGKEVGVIRALLEAGADVHIRNEDEATLLHIAAKHGRRCRDDRAHSVSCELLPLLLEFGMQENINARDKWGRTPLFYALNCYESALLLIKAGANVHTKNDSGATLLHEAAQICGGDVMRLLLRQGMQEELNALDEEAFTPLHIAISVGNFEAVRLLVEAGADIHRNDDGTPLHWAAQSANNKILDFLLRHGMQEDINARDNSGRTPLFHALDCYECALLLIEAGANVHIHAYSGSTLLHEATRIYSCNAMRLLLRQGMQEELNALDEEAFTPLHIAISVGNFEAVHLLVEAGADIRRNDVWTPLHCAAEYGSVEILNYLLRHSMQEGRNACVEEGNALLRIALSSNQNEGARMLLESGVDIHAEDEEQGTWLHAAAWGANAEMLKYLLENGLKDKVNARDCVGATPLHYACRRSQSSECVRILLEAGADVHARLWEDYERPGQTPLHVAVNVLQEHDYEVIRLLIEAGADVNTAADDGRTLLMDVVTRAKDEPDTMSGILRLLLESGADVHAVDKEGKTALDYVEAPLYPSALLQKWAEKK